MKNNIDFYNTTQAAEKLGLYRDTVRKFILTGILRTDGRVGHQHLISEESISMFRQRYLNDGMTLADIAKAYGKTRPSVSHHFRTRLRVRPDGINIKRKRAFCYSPSTVAKFAKIMGWELVTSQNQTDE